MSVGGALAAATGLNAIGSIITGSNASSAAKDAARVQADSASKANDLQLQMFHEAMGNLQPFISGGADAREILARLTGTSASMSDPRTAWLTAKLDPHFDPTIEQLEKTPGYQFTKDQGLKATTNALASQGLAGPGGALGKGLANYAEGLASTTYQNMFQNYQTEYQNQLAQNSQIFNMLQQQAQVGAGAASAGAGASASFAGPIGQTASNVGAAQAGGIVGSANALTGAVNNITGNVSQLATIAALQKGGLFGSTPAAATGNV